MEKGQLAPTSPLNIGALNRHNMRRAFIFINDRLNHLESLSLGLSSTDQCGQSDHLLKSELEIVKSVLNKKQKEEISKLLNERDEKLKAEAVAKENFAKVEPVNTNVSPEQKDNHVEGLGQPVSDPAKTLAKGEIITSNGQKATPSWQPNVASSE